jgi:precorrin-6A/cobalt-precorrin-6A reductase
MRVLLLGGTAEARAVASVLVDDGVDVVSSLAGRVQRPRLPAGAVRVGGFGGVDGLRAGLDGFDVVLDATHPFAATISGSAATACGEAGVPLLRLVRPGWSSLPGSGRWHWVFSHEEAADVARGLGTSVFLTTGRQTLSRFVPALLDSSVLVRVVDPVEVELPERWRVLLARGPYTMDGERSLMQTYDVRVLVTKDSGGGLTRAKLDAADDLGVEVVVVRRPTAPAGVEEVSDVPGAVRWLRAQQRRAP